MNLGLLLGNRARVLCMGPVSRLLPLAARFPSLLPVDLKNIYKLSTQEGSQGPQQAQPGWDTPKHWGQIAAPLLPTPSENPVPREFAGRVRETGDQGLMMTLLRDRRQSLLVD